jgi:carbonic anhydrase
LSPPDSACVWPELNLFPQARLTEGVRCRNTLSRGTQSWLPAILGLPRADIDVIRTGGPAVTDDVLGELVVSNQVLGTTEIMLLNHTGCGFTTFTDDELNKKLSASTGDASPAPMRFFSYKDPEQHAREQIKKVRSHPWIAKEVPVRGFIFDMETGLLKEVNQAAKHTAA